jgi:hypothetical protein
MEPWTLVRFSLNEVTDGVVTRLMSDLMSIALEDLREVGVFSSELTTQGQCLYFSPGAATAFASALTELPIERCDPPSAETPLCLYGAAECLPPSDGRVECSIPADTAPAGRVVELVELEDDSSRTPDGWSSVQYQITRLLPEIPREESTRHSLVAEDPSAYSRTYRLLRAALVVGTAAVIIVLVLPYLAWFAVLVVR